MNKVAIPFYHILKKIYGATFSLSEDLTYTLFEYPKGIDFSKRATAAHSMCKDMMPYRKTPTRRLMQAFKEIPHTKEQRSLLDVGCGKGYVLKIAANMSIFSKVGGLEYDQDMANICKRNMNHLGLNTVEVFQGNAQDFTKYEEYNTFFFFNPFGSEIFKEVLKRLPTQDCIIIYFNPVCHQDIVKDGRFDLIKQLYDGHKATPINIYQNIA